MDRPAGGGAPTRFTAWSLGLLGLVALVVVLCLLPVFLADHDAELPEPRREAASASAALEADLAEGAHRGAGGPAREPARRPTTGSLLIRVVYEEDGAPVPGHLLRVVSEGDRRPLPLILRELYTTDERGLHLIEEVLPGVVGVYSVTAGSVQVDVEPGVETEAVLTVPEGLSIRGRVVDSAGGPIPGAQVFGAATSDQRGGVPLTSTDAAGQFVVTGIVGSYAVWARHDAYAPSAREDLRHEKAKDGELTVELVLGPVAGGVRGHLYKPDGSPARGALVRVGPERTIVQRRRAEPGLPDRRAHPAGVTCTTDERGFYQVLGLEPGDTSVAFRVETLAPERHAVEIRAGEIATVDAYLKEGCVVVGHVRDEEGDGVVGCRVSFGTYGAIDAAFAVSGPEGSFRLEGLPAGLCKLTASAGRGRRVRAELDLQTGAPLRWDPVLPTAEKLRGRLKVRAGMTPVDWTAEGWKVHVRNLAERVGRGPAAYVQEDGSFTLEVLTGYPLRVYAAPAGEPAADRVFRDLPSPPGKDEVILLVLDDARPSGGFQGRLLALDGEPVRGRRVFAHRGGFNTGQRTTSEGLFRFRHLRPGAWSLTVSADEADPKRHLGLFQVKPGRMEDVGNVTLSELGTLKLAWSQPADPSPPSDGRSLARIKTPEGLSVVSDSVAGTGAFRPFRLEPGEYVLEFTSSIYASFSAPFSIAAGETVQRTIPMQPGIREEVLLLDPDMRGGLKAWLSVNSDKGPTLTRIEARREGGAFAWGTVLPPGTYLGEILTETGIEQTVLVHVGEDRDPTRAQLSGTPGNPNSRR